MIRDQADTDLARALPYLRRYARSLTGRQSAGDAVVRDLLESSLHDSAIRAEIRDGAIALFRAFTRLWMAGDVPHPPSGVCEHSSQIARMPSLPRQALLLHQLEGFSIAQTGAILGLPESEADKLVQQALAELRLDEPVRVLVIEDVGLIASHLESIIAEAGHCVVANATTAAQAKILFAREQPDLVLSDVQLADGSSGIDAVDAIAELSDAPVIFITAFPEMLLTGERPEPAFLIGKPFRDETVRAAISQALFFGSHGRQ
ncbi:response regulator [Novosphingobium sp. PASSN1]|uniref:response regulator n=1 Tax=Novosphingobium sp. PASSN1 TaxID=2015561 RepID=UPI0025FD31E2|nr:response regulator [Novosphingobium sp. PASSN1]